MIKSVDSKVTRFSSSFKLRHNKLIGEFSVSSYNLLVDSWPSVVTYRVRWKRKYHTIVVKR